MRATATGLSVFELRRLRSAQLGPLEEFAGRYSTEERRRGAKEGWALPDSSFPIKTAQDVKDAIGLVGNYKGPYNPKAHIKKRAAALGVSNLIPEGW